MDINSRIGDIIDKKEAEQTKPDGTKKEPATKKLITWVPLFRSGCEHLPKDLEEVDESYERFLSGFETPLSLIQQAIYEGKKKSFSGSAGKIISVLIDAVSNKNAFPDWPEEAILDPITWYILEENFDWNEDKETEYLVKLQKLGVKGIDYPEFEEEEA